MLNIREIKQEDNPHIAYIIKSVLTEFGADPKTTMLGDPRAESMFEQYQSADYVYFIAELNGEVVGGCGIQKLSENETEICELQRMYLCKKVRGQQIGKNLIELSIKKAKQFGYKKIYLETISNMLIARVLYQRYGFKIIENYLGETGHSGCDIKMLLEF
jgi:putative acetyltransferase